MATLTIIIVDGFVFAAILFLLSVGLTLIFGVLRILNISHGGIYALGAYMGTFLALKILDWGWNPYLTYVMLLAGALIIGLIVGPLIERLFLRRVYGQAEAIQLLLTFAILLILEDLIKLIWGTTPMPLPSAARRLPRPLPWHRVLLSKWWCSRSRSSPLAVWAVWKGRPWERCLLAWPEPWRSTCGQNSNWW